MGVYKKNPSTPDLHINCNLTSDNMPKIHPETKVLIIKRLKTRSTAEVADTFNVSPSRTEDKKKYEETGDVFDKPRSGRPLKTTAREDRLLARKSKASPFSTAAELHETWSQILSRNGLHGRISAQKPALCQGPQPAKRMDAGKVAEGGFLRWIFCWITSQSPQILQETYWSPRGSGAKFCSRMVLHRILPSLHQSSSRRRRSKCSRIGQPSHQTWTSLSMSGVGWKRKHGRQNQRILMNSGRHARLLSLLFLMTSSINYMNPCRTAWMQSFVCFVDLLDCCGSCGRSRGHAPSLTCTFLWACRRAALLIRAEH